MPAMLGYLGDAHFGIWMTATAITGMAQFSDLGIGNGLLTRLSAALGREDMSAARSDISSAYAILTLVALMLGALAGIFLLLFGKLHMSIVAEHNSLLILAATLGTFFATIPASIIQRVMYARQQVLLSNLWQIASAVLAVASCLGAIALKLPPWATVLAYGLPTILMLVISACWYFGRHPELRPHFSDVSRSSSVSLLSLGLRFLALGVLTSVALNADNVIIAANAGPHAVTQYAVPAKIGSLLGLVITTIFLPLWAANGEALARGDREWVKTNTRRMAWIGGAAVAAAAIVLTLAGDWIIHLWMGRGFIDQQWILGLLGGLSVAMALSSPYQMVLNSLGIIRPQVWAAIAFLAVSLPLKLLLVTTETLWLVPLISMSVYFMTILPVVRFATSAALRRY